MVQNSLTLSSKLGGSVTVIVRLEFTVEKLFPEIDRLKFGISMKPEGKIEPCEILTKKGILYFPTCESDGTIILNGAGRPELNEEKFRFSRDKKKGLFYNFTIHFIINFLYFLLNNIDFK